MLIGVSGPVLAVGPGDTYPHAVTLALAAGGDFGVRNPFVPPRPEAPLQFAQAAAPVAADVSTGDGTAPPEEQLESATASEAGGSGEGGIAAEVVGDDEFLPADELDVPLPAGPRPAPGAQVAVERPAGRQWGLAPVRWGGQLSAGLRYNWADDAPNQNSQIYEGRLRVNSYIMQPYIALVSGDFGLTFFRSQVVGGGGTDSGSFTGTSINGNGSLNVFPQSRFPFQATLALSDSRSDGTLTATNTQRRRLSLRQDYRPALGNWRTSGQYDRSELSGSFGRDTVDRLGAEYSIQLGQHSLGANGSWSSNRRTDGTQSDVIGIFRHGFRASDSLSIDSTATYTGQEFDIDRANLRLSGDTRSAQLFSFASWTPADSPWRGTANLRFFDNRSTVGISEFASRSLGGSASLSYEASRNLRLFGVLSANSSESGGARNVTTSQTVGANYSSDTHMFGQYGYNWYGSTSFVNSTASEGDGQRSVNASLGHSVQRTWNPTAVTQLRGSFNQSVNANRSSGGDAVSSSTLNNTASLTLQAAPSDRISGFLSASLSDSRTFGDNEGSFQLLNTQLSGNWRIDAVSQLTSNLTWQVSRQSSTLTDILGAGTTTRSNTNNISGSLGYSNVRFFGVRNLRYTADFRADTSQSSQRAAGDPDAGRDRVSLDLDQRLRYRIGRLDTELQARIGRVEDRNQGLIFFKVSRDFGAF